MSEPEQRKYNYVCNTTINKVEDRATAPSNLAMQVECLDKMGGASRFDLDAEIAGSRITLRSRK